GNIAITRAEADALFRINDGTCEEMNHPSWNELFVKAIANFVLAASGYEVPARAQAVRGGEARWLTERIMNDRLIRDNERALLQFIRKAASVARAQMPPNQS